MPRDITISKSGYDPTDLDVGAYIARMCGKGHRVFNDLPLLQVQGIDLPRGSYLKTRGAGSFTSPDQPTEDVGLRTSGGDSTLDIKVRDLRGNDDRADARFIHNTGDRNTISIDGAGIGVGGYALIDQASTAEYAVYPKLKLADCDNRTKGFRVTGPRGGSIPFIEFGSVFTSGAMFLLDPEPGRIGLVKMRRLTVTGTQETGDDSSVNGCKAEHVERWEIDEFVCAMPLDKERHFGMRFGNGVGDVLIKRANVTHPFGALVAGGLRRLTVETLESDHLNDIGGASPWFVHHDRAAKVEAHAKRLKV